MKYRLLISIPFLALVALLLWWMTPEADSVRVQEQLPDSAVVVPDSVAVQKIVAERNFRIVDTSLDPYLVDGLTGYTATDLSSGIITVRRNIPRDIYLRTLPDYIPDSDSLKTAHDVYLYIVPSHYFPDGDCGMVSAILVNDTIIQVQFQRRSPAEMIDNLSDNVDRLLGTLHADSLGF